MNRRSKPGLAARRRTKSNVRRQARRRFLLHLLIAAVLAVVLNARLAKTIVDPHDPIAQAQPAAATPSLAHPAPTAGPTRPTAPSALPTQPALTFTAPNPVEQTAIALESATPPPTIGPSQQPPTPTETAIPPTRTPTPTHAIPATALPSILYTTQPGDTLPVLALRFGVSPDEIVHSKQQPLPAEKLIDPGELLVIPRRLTEATSRPDILLPDSGLVFSPSAASFDGEAFVASQGGYLSTYKDYLGSTGWTSGAQIIQRVALDNSINPRLLMALLEYRANWVAGQPTSVAETYYPLGALDRDQRGLFNQLNYAVDQLSLGYYGWREGLFTNLTLADGSSVRLAPELNSGTVGLMYLLAKDLDRAGWEAALYGEDSLPATYQRLFGDPWEEAARVEPLLPTTLTQPVLLLPFAPGREWSFTGGPHAAWNRDGARAALDFAPPAATSGCVESEQWVTAAATGQVVRVGNGFVVMDLDGDGREQTGWALLYLHIAARGRQVQVGDFVEVGKPIGHPSCEGGLATGTHVHIARKYNGEWILADGPLPFVLSGWEAHAGELPYQGSLTKDDQTVKACTCSSRETFIAR